MMDRPIFSLTQVERTDTDNLLRMKEQGEIVLAADEVIVSQTLADHENLKREDIVIKVVNPHKDGRSILFSHELPEAAVASFEKIETALRTNDFEGITGTAIEGLKKIHAFSKKHGAKLEWVSQNGHQETHITITPETVIGAQVVISGTTTIYGRLLRIGGKDPTVQIELTETQTITCPITLQFARTLAPMIYSWVGLKGNGKWDVKTKKLIEFSAKSISEYRETPLEEAIEWLKETIGPYYADIDDVDQYVHDLRDDEEDT